MGIDPGYIERLKDAITLSDVVGRFVALKKAGREYKAPCPFHNEKTASFYVNDQKGFAHCFGCGTHVDAIGFLQRMENVSFPEAVERLAAESGLPPPEVTADERRAHAHRRDMFALVETAARWFEQQLAGAEGDEARAYLAQRGLTEDTIVTARLGWAPPGGQALRRHLLAEGFLEADAIEAGVLTVDSVGERAGQVRSFFRRRVVFPIADGQGRIIAFGGRLVAGDGPKYLNTPETPLFDKGSTLYGWGRARRAVHDGSPLILVEGYMDVLALAQAGFPGAVAPLGTALTERQISKIYRAKAEGGVFAPVFVFDGDRAGQRAAARTIDRLLPALTPGRSARFATPPGGADPDSLIRDHGPEAMVSLIDAARPLADVLWDSEMEERPLGTPEEKAGLVASVERRLLAIADDQVRTAYAADYGDRLAEALGYRPPLLAPAPPNAVRRAQLTRGVAGAPGSDPSGLVAAALCYWRGRGRLAPETPARRWLGRIGLVDGDDSLLSLAAGEAEYIWSEEGDPRVHTLGVHPVLVAGMARWDRGADAAGAVRAVLLQFLTPDGRPARFSDPVTGARLPGWRVVGDGGGAAVRLGALSGEDLVIATGLAMGVAAWLACRRESPVWAVPNVSAVRALALPSRVRRVTLVGVDRVAEHQIDQAVARLAADGSRKGRDVRVAHIPTGAGAHVAA